MVGSRTLTALAGLAASGFVSVALWWYLDTLAVFLFLPFVPFLFRRGGSSREQPETRECPTCGYRTRDHTHDYCPRDGSRLRRE